jgi:predicted metalloendopeptidase
LQLTKQDSRLTTWLTSSTQKQALKKLNAITLKIGYPDKLSDLYDQIQVSSDKSLYENIIAANQTKLFHNFSQLNEPVDRLFGALIFQQMRLMQVIIQQIMILLSLQESYKSLFTV